MLLEDVMEAKGRVQEKLVDQLVDSIPNAKGYFEVSSKIGTDVDKLFEAIAMCAFEKYAYGNAQAAVQGFKLEAPPSNYDTRFGRLQRKCCK